MKSGVNIKKKHVYFAVGLLIILTGVFFVNAYGTSNPSAFGHTASEIDYSDIACGNICNDADTQDLSYAPSTDVISLTNGGSVDITEVDTDTRCDVSGTCSQICIGTDCKSAWPISCNWNGEKIVQSDEEIRSCTTQCCPTGQFCLVGSCIEDRTNLIKTTCSGSVGGEVISMNYEMGTWSACHCSGTCGYILCPFFYSWNSEEYVLETTFIVDKQSEEEKATTYNKIEQLQIFDSPKAVIKEIDPETSYIDMIKIKVTLNNGNIIYLNPVWASRDLNKILEIDGENMITEQGDEVYLEFEELDSKYEKIVSKMEIEANGYYNVYEGWHHDPHTHLIVPE